MRDNSALKLGFRLRATAPRLRSCVEQCRNVAVPRLPTRWTIWRPSLPRAVTASALFSPHEPRSRPRWGALLAAAISDARNGRPRCPGALNGGARDGGPPIVALAATILSEAKYGTYAKP